MNQSLLIAENLTGGYQTRLPLGAAIADANAPLPPTIVYQLNLQIVRVGKASAMRNR